MLKISSLGYIIFFITQIFPKKSKKMYFSPDKTPCIFVASKSISL